MCSASVSFNPELVRGYAHSPSGQKRGLIAEEHNLPYEEVDRWPSERVEYYLARMAGVAQWRENKADERREERETETPRGGHTPRSRNAPSSSQAQAAPTSTPATPPDGWTQEEWDHVPQSMKGRVGSDGGYVSKEAVQRYMNKKET